MLSIAAKVGSYASEVADKMTSYAKDAPRLDKVILLVACGLAALIIAQMAFWESRQQQLMDRLTDLVQMQQSQLAALSERVNTNRRDLERGGR